MIYSKLVGKEEQMDKENYQTMSMFRLSRECLAGNGEALKEWERRWEAKFPEIKKLPDWESGNSNK
jgi:hypothetical protein